MFPSLIGPTLPRQNSQLPAQVQNGPSQEELEIQRRQLQEQQRQKELERERMERERLERERLERERLERERLEQEQLELQRQEREHVERLERERLERLERERQDRERLEQLEQVEWERERRVSNAGKESADLCLLPPRWARPCAVVEDGSFSSGGSTVGVNLASSKTDAGRGNGPLPLGGSGLMEEMSALLARRRRIAEKGSTIETEQKEDRSEDSEPVPPKASSTSTPGKRDSPRKNQIVFDNRSYDSLHRPKSTPSSQPSANGVQTEGLDYDRLKQDILDEMRKELAKLKEELIDAIRQELSKSNTA
ncbi:hypothetical protein A6R68_07137 [Neotoma lepida]|uniref:VASP tetramerisation domain-containing protein n=1 Tax=Neotoma lepida TaxID=56216 RepID=A0A1A6GDJ9_NEOLE|nr:hypothetical protein A6R68_07137 [Neotoma lepida]